MNNSKKPSLRRSCLTYLLALSLLKNLKLESSRLTVREREFLTGNKGSLIIVSPRIQPTDEISIDDVYSEQLRSNSGALYQSVKFDVSKPLRRAKKVTIPGGEVVNILYDYERIQKRCYTCQRLTHEQSLCPIEKAIKAAGNKKEVAGTKDKEVEDLESMESSDPLFGLVPAKLLGIDKNSGKPKIAKEVMENMRIYIKSAFGPEKIAREERVKKSLQDLENDPFGQKIMLRLEPPPVVSTILDKGKGVVFDFAAKSDKPKNTEKLMAGAIMAGSKVLQSGKVVTQSVEMEGSAESTQSAFFQEGSTGYNIGVHETSVSGTTQKNKKQRKRPGTFIRKANGKGVARGTSNPGKKIGEGVVSDAKRKANDDVEPSQSSARFKKLLVVPTEGSSNI
ncbi:hypothetical protein N665_0455s0002 [Sinapis alba]|nr:hypothetical protein N665_0455s0002 [Sinapis alba]